MSKYLFLLFPFLILSCEEEPLMNEVPEYVMAGGATTIFDVTSNAYSTPAPNLSSVNFEKHLAGDLAFEQIFVTEPGEINPGLGPLFNNNSCVSCHARNGRSRPAENGDDISGFLLRLSIPGENLVGGPKSVPFFGTQLQTRSIYGSEVEGSFSTEKMVELVEFLDGDPVELSKRNYQIESPYESVSTEVLISPRIAPAVFGLGLLEAIPESDILSLVDEDDADGDGISGKINRVWNENKGIYERGIFGWKSEMPTALMQAADAYHQDMGITTEIFPAESCNDQSNCNADDIIDLSNESLEETTFYFQTLAVPAVRNYNDPAFLLGQDLFASLQCDGCHIPKQRTGSAIIPALSNQVIYPYTDLLLHDMGEGLTDNRPSFEAEGNEWRTAPLWGLGLLPVVNGHMSLMHDGRAKTIEEAILWHGGEAQSSKTEFIELSSMEREALVFYVKSL